MTIRRFHVVVAVAAMLIVAACGGGGAASKPGADKSVAPSHPGDVNNGKALFQNKGCIACHVAAGVPGATGTIGPNLNGIGDPSKRAMLTDGDKNTPANIKEWIKDPGKRKPGTMMPNLNLSEKEADDLTAFMTTLR
jgi:cytochrome c2